MSIVELVFSFTLCLYTCTCTCVCVQFLLHLQCICPLQRGSMFNVWSLVISVSVEDSVVVINKLAEDEVKEEVQFKRKRTCSIGQLASLALFIPTG